MARKFTDPTLLLGSTNTGKIEEFRPVFSTNQVQILSLKDYAPAKSLPEPQETEPTFLGNAILKANYYCKATGYPTLADDSGVEIHALDGRPGVYTKDFLTEHGGPAKALIKLQEMLAGKETSATLVGALALVWPDGHCETVEATCSGHLVFPARGGGFGVDPIFQPDGYDQTFGENQILKDRLSHRAQALVLLLKKCF